MDIGIERVGGLGEIPVGPSGEGRFKFLPVVDGGPLKVLPVIEAGPPQLFFIHAKSEWPDEPQVRTGRQATAADVPGVRGNLWLVEDHV